MSDDSCSSSSISSSTDSSDDGAGGSPNMPSNRPDEDWDPQPYHMYDPPIPGVPNVPVKVVMIGDGNTGKTSLMQSYYFNKSPLPYIPTVFDNWLIDRRYESTVYSIGFWDTGGGEEYHRLRPLSYPHTDLFVLCFSVVNRVSFDNVTSMWIPELKQHQCGNVRLLIVGTKIDLREDEATLKKLKNNNMKVVTREEGEALAASLNSRYIETTVIGLDEPTNALTISFMTPLLQVLAMGPPTVKPPKKKGQCFVM